MAEEGHNDQERCGYCLATIADDAQHCVYCGAKFQNSSMTDWEIIIAIAGALIVLLAAQWRLH